MERGKGGKRVLAWVITGAVFAGLMFLALLAAFVMLLCGANGWLVLAFVFAAGVVSCDIGDRVTRPRFQKKF